MHQFFYVFVIIITIRKSSELLSESLAFRISLKILIFDNSFYFIFCVTEAYHIWRDIFSKSVRIQSISCQ